MSQAPNTLLIEVDQWNARCLGILNNPNLRTPSLDRLARRGRLYTNAYCNSPICLPSRISMLAGRYVSTTCQFGFSGLCEPDLPWLQNDFRQAGYATGAFGKFHVLSIGDQQWQFDTAAPTLPEEINMARPKGNDYKTYCDRKGVPWPTDQIHGHNPFRAGFRHFPSSASEDMPFPLKFAQRSDVSLADSLETWTTDRCLDFLRGCAAEPGSKPFFAWLTYDRPHMPTSLPPEWFDRVRPEAFKMYPEPGADDFASMTPSLFHEYMRRDSRFALGADNFRFILATYYTLMEFIDSEIGRVMTALEELGLAETTTVVFTADHGDEAGYRGLYNKADGVSSEEICRVPLIISPAPCLNAAAPGARCEAPVELVDLYPTLTELAGVEARPGAEGVSLAPNVLRNDPLPADRAVFCEHIHIRSTVHEGWKLGWGDRADECSLFDLAEDPNCMRNLYKRTDELHTRKRIELKRGLLAFLMHRLHGGYSQADADWIEDAFDPGSDHIGPCLCTDVDHVQHFRAGAFVQGGGSRMFVPFYDERPITLFPKGNYHKWPDALPFDAEIVETLLDAALAELYGGFHSVSILYRWLARLEPTEENIRELLEKG